jgi:hypothetical protein
VLNVLFLPVPTFTSTGALPLQLEQRIRNLNNIIKQNQDKLTILIKCGEIITHLTVQTLVEYTILVDSFFFHSVLLHSLLLTLATSNERKIWLQTLGIPVMRN